MIAVINDFISTRGVSGSSRGAGLIHQALSEGGAADAGTSLTPRRKPKTRLGRLAQMLTWDFLSAPRAASRLGAGVIIHATNTGRGWRGVKSVVVMHDTMVLDHSTLFNAWFGLYARITFGLSARSAHTIVAPSHHSAARIAARWPRAAARVRVIPWPAPEASVVRDGGDIASNARLVVLVVASLDKHKRLGLAVEVVARLRSDTGEDVHLEMVVRSGNDEQAVLATIAALEDSSWVRLHRQISDSELAHLYATASVTLVPSLDEGYCLPAVESIARGTPVVHAGRGALPEVIPMYPAAPAGQDDAEILYERLSEVREGGALERQLEDLRARSENFSLSTFRSRWLQVVRDLAE